MKIGSWFEGGVELRAKFIYRKRIENRIPCGLHVEN